MINRTLNAEYGRVTHFLINLSRATCCVYRTAVNRGYSALCAVIRSLIIVAPSLGLILGFRRIYTVLLVFSSLTQILANYAQKCDRFYGHRFLLDLHAKI